MESECEQEVARTLARGVPMSILLIDIDNFKAVNDENGHIAGDAALRTLAAMLQASLRDVDRVYRFGGDEFVVLGKGLGTADASRLAERLRRQTAELRLEGVRGPFTISIGVATGPDDGRTFIELLGQADQRLYSAKGDGRNRIVTGDSDRTRAGDGDGRLMHPT